MPINRVIPQLYIGDIEGAQDLKGLQAAGVTHILQAMGGMEPVYPSQFKYKAINIRDVATENIACYFPQIVKWMTEVINSGGTIYVHCFAGISRSAAVVIAYLMYDHQMGMDSAALLTRKARPTIYPNPGFLAQLQAYEKQLKSSRYQANQRARYPEDYTSMQLKIKKFDFDKRPAGRRQDVFQLNKGHTKDRLGANGLVNKGQSFVIKRNPLDGSDAMNRTQVSFDHQTRWNHNYEAKPHSYFSRTFSEEFNQIGGGLSKTDQYLYGLTMSPMRSKQYSGHPMSSLTANLNPLKGSNPQSQHVLAAIVQKQDELKRRQQVIEQEIQKYKENAKIRSYSDNKYSKNRNMTVMM